MKTMITFIEYLQKEGYSPSTIKNYNHNIQLFLQWAEKQKCHLPTFDYKAALRYVAYLQEKRKNVKTINITVISIRSYFRYLIHIGEHHQNPFAEIRIKGEIKHKIRSNLLSEDELEDLYYSYSVPETKNYHHILTAKRNKIIIGLLVYQGVSVADLHKVKVEHLQLQKGTLYIPKGKIGNNRKLELKPWQIIGIMEYLQEVRPKLLSTYKGDTEALLVSKRGNLVGVMEIMIRKLRQINQKVENTHQIRASVIVLWLSRYNLRRVQYMAGHKRISNTESYLQQDLEELQLTIANFHPIK